MSSHRLLGAQTHLKPGENGRMWGGKGRGSNRPRPVWGTGAGRVFVRSSQPPRVTKGRAICITVFVCGPEGRSCAWVVPYSGGQHLLVVSSVIYAAVKLPSPGSLREDQQMGPKRKENSSRCRPHPLGPLRTGPSIEKYPAAHRARLTESHCLGPADWARPAGSLTLSHHAGAERPGPDRRQTDKTA